MISKVPPAPGYPPEEGRYMRGNPYSPVIVVVVLDTFDHSIPDRIAQLARAGLEAGAALSGLLQTANVGIEKIIANVVANSNIRYLVLCGPESEGHKPGDALRALMNNGVDENQTIRGSIALTPTLYNTSPEVVERFRHQITLVDLLWETDPDVVREAVNACIQEEPTEFRGYQLYDTGAYPEPPIARPLTWKVTTPWNVVSEEEQEILDGIIKAAKEKAKRD